MTKQFIIQFYSLSGLKKEKKFKTFEDAKEHYDSYINNMEFWYNITMVKRTNNIKKIIPKNYFME